MNVVLLRVGIDKGSGGILGPLFSDGRFEFIPIDEERWPESRTYGNTPARTGGCLIDYFPPARRAAMKDVRLHFDPEFGTFTYGDPTQPKRGLHRLQPGDILVLYAGLQGWNCDVPPALYIVGFFEVEHAGFYPLLVEGLGKREIHRLFRNNPHVRYGDPKHHDLLVLVKGGGKSRLLRKAVRISALQRDIDRGGHPVFVLDRGMKKHFGSFTSLNAIQRSIPRWVPGEYVERAALFVRSLK
jgi:hypothetical protein